MDASTFMDIVYACFREPKPFHTMQIGSWCDTWTELVPVERTLRAIRLWTEGTHTG